MAFKTVATSAVHKVRVTAAIARSLVTAAQKPRTSSLRETTVMAKGGRATNPVR